MLRVRLFGGFLIELDGRPVTLSSRPSQSLLAYLILDAGTPHRREHMAGLLWPDLSDVQARNNLRNHLWRIRQALEIPRALPPASAKREKRAEPSSKSSGVPYFLADDLTLRFNAESEYWLDVSAVNQIEAEHAPTDQLMETLSLVRGELLPGFYQDWVERAREQEDAIVQFKLEKLLQRLQEEQRWNDVLEWGERWIALGSSPEPAYRALMRAHAALGNRSQVATVNQRMLQALRDDLGVEPSERTRELFAKLSSGADETPAISPLSRQEPATARGATRETSSNNLPAQLTSFIGREPELAELKALLSTHRLVTLTGVGGTGKTRLAIELGRNVLSDFPGGIWYVELAPLSDPILVPVAVAAALGVREQPGRELRETLADFLAGQELLLLLDNCEHLIAACAALAEYLLRLCPRLHVLATSREKLAVIGEKTFHVLSLSLPSKQAEGEIDLDRLARYEAVRLFVERAQSAFPGFTLTRQNAPDVLEVCRRLDGIPLAIELAAARVPLLRVEQIAARLSDRFQLLTGGTWTRLPRHQTLRAAIDWSYDILSSEEKTLLPRLSVFAGGWTLEAAEAICAGELVNRDQILDLLSQLFAKSMISIERAPRADARFDMLETIRQYAREKLVQTAEEEIRTRHLLYFADLAERAEPHLYRSQEAVWLRRLDPEIDNLRAAVDWSMDPGPTGDETGPVRIERGLRLTGSLMRFWLSRVNMWQIMERMGRMLALPVAGKRTATRVKALNALGFMHFMQNRMAEGLPLVLEALTLARELREPRLIAASLMYSIPGYDQAGEYETALTAFEEGARICQALGDAALSTRCFGLAFVGDLFYSTGAYPRARESYQQALALLRPMDEMNWSAMVVRRLGQLALAQGEYREAIARTQESLAVNRMLGLDQAVAACLLVFGAVALRYADSSRTGGVEGFVHAAVQLFGQAGSLLERAGSRLLRIDQIEYDKNLARAHRMLDEAAFSRHWLTGQKMSLDEAIAFTDGAMEKIERVKI